MLRYIIFTADRFTKRLIVPSQIILFLLSIILLYLFKERIIRFISEIPRNKKKILTAIFFLGLLLRIFLPIHEHVMFIDEPWHMESAKNIIQTGNQDYYQKPIGWPFVLTIPFLIFGINNYVAIYTNIFIGSLTIFLIYFLALKVTKSHVAPLFSALLLAIAGDHIKWSATAEANLSGLFFIILGIILAITKKNNNMEYILGFSATIFFASFRPESYTLIPIYLLFNIKYFKKIISDKRILIAFLLVGMLTIPNLIRVLTFKIPYSPLSIITFENNVNSPASTIISSFLMNLTSLLGLFHNDFFSIPLLIAFTIGVIYSLKNKEKDSKVLYVYLFLLMYIYLFGVRYFYNMGGGTFQYSKSRFYMMFYPTTLVVSSLIFKRYPYNKVKINKNKQRLKNYITLILSILIVLTQVLSLSQVPSMLSGHKLSTIVLSQIHNDIPDNCIVVSPMPAEISAVNNIKTKFVEDFIQDIEFNENVTNYLNQECYFYYEGRICNDHLQRPYCEKMHEHFYMSEKKEYTDGDKSYFIYSIEMPKNTK